MEDDKKIYFSKISSPESFDFNVIEYEPCKCGKTLERALREQCDVMIHLTFAENLFRQQVVCWECFSLNPLNPS